MRKACLFGMAALLLLTSSVFLFSCSGGDDPGGRTNPFVGTWITSSPAPATLKFGASDWALTIPSLSITEKGDYTSGNLDTYAYLNQNGANVGQAVISNSVMTVHFSIAGPLNTAVYQFTRQK